MAKPIIVTLDGAESSFDHSKIERELGLVFTCVSCRAETYSRARVRSC